MLVLAGSRAGAVGESDLLRVRIMLDCELRLASLNLVAFLADTFVGDIVALVLLLLLRFRNVEMTVDESVGEFILRDGRRQQLRNSPAEETLLQNLPHARSSVRILNQHISKKILQVLAIVSRDLRVTTSQDLEHEPLH